MTKYELVGGYNGLTPAELRNFLGMYLEGPAGQWYQSLTGTAIPADWQSTFLLTENPLLTVG